MLTTVLIRDRYCAPLHVHPQFVIITCICINMPWYMYTCSGIYTYMPWYIYTYCGGGIYIHAVVHIYIHACSGIYIHAVVYIYIHAVVYNIQLWCL